MGSIQKVAACVLIFVIAIARMEIISTSEIPITFSLIVSYGRFGYNSSPGIPAIDLALEHIHSSGFLGKAVFYRARLRGTCTASEQLYKNIGRK